MQTSQLLLYHFWPVGESCWYGNLPPPPTPMCCCLAGRCNVFNWRGLLKSSTQNRGFLSYFENLKELPTSWGHVTVQYLATCSPSGHIYLTGWLTHCNMSLLWIIQYVVDMCGLLSCLGCEMYMLVFINCCIVDILAAMVCLERVGEGSFV